MRYFMGPPFQLKNSHVGHGVILGIDEHIVDLPFLVQRLL